MCDYEKVKMDAKRVVVEFLEQAKLTEALQGRQEPFFPKLVLQNKPVK